MRKLSIVLALCLGFTQAALGETTGNARLQNLFNNLASAGNSESSLAIARNIEVLWLQQPSSAADLLMRRATIAIQSQQFETALKILNSLVRMSPRWAEAWNKRATVRYQLEDDLGSLSDIERVLELEPRHFGALSGEAMIYERLEKKPEALQAYRQMLQIAPQWPDLKGKVDRLTIMVEGQGI